MVPLKVAPYLDRIGYTGDLAPTSATLRALQNAHLFAVPFENLDVAWRIPITIDVAAFYDKIVTRRRGGFCYELNGLFGWLLQELGFDVMYLSASDAREDGTFGPEFDHLVLAVTSPADSDSQTQWLADVGWGDTFRNPLRLQTDIEQPEGRRVYWLTEAEDGRLILHQREGDGSEELQYAFTRQTHKLADFAGMCHYQQSSPDSHFTRQRLCTLATPDGRITLRDNRLIETRGETRTITEISDAQFDELLGEKFGIKRPISQD